ncbi:MAG TPA: mannose-1-phosphate guanylyltransferase, partial [bacterium]|nr:mannose-1-phosphate guanylyltransferase [bacterium]
PAARPKSGTRFWPRSRAHRPKQLLNIFGEHTMIQHTVNRIASIAKPSEILVVTNKAQASEVHRQLPQLPSSNILVEPVGRNTAPCIGLAALHVMEKDPNGVMVVLAADHLITPDDVFCKTVEAAAEVALRTEACVTIGIVPTRPETGYGYIQFIENESLEAHGEKAYRVKTFAEKPNLETAKSFIATGDFLWNSGMFVWKASTILRLIEMHLPELYEGLVEIRPTIGTADYTATVDQVYRRIKGISIDYGVMEHTKEVYVLKGHFRWNDVGSWEEVYQLSNKDENGNAVIGQAVCIEANNSLLFSPGKMIALVGVSDLIVVETEDALMICPRDRAQDVKKIVETLQAQKKNELL